MTSNYRAVFTLFLAAFIAGLGWILSKEAIAGMPAAGFIGLRFLIGAAILLPFCWRDFSRTSGLMIFRAIVIGCLMGSYMLIWIYTINISDTLAEGGFILSLSMLFVPLVSWALFKQKPVKTFWVALPVAIVGLLLLSLTGGWRQSFTQILFLINAILLALTFCLNSRYVQFMPVILLTCIQLLCVGFIGSVVSLIFEPWPTYVTPEIWGWFIASVLIATCLRYVIQIHAQKFVNPTTAAFIMLLEPIWIMIFSITWYNEHMPPQKLLGCALILSALLVYRGLMSKQNKPIIKQK